MTPLVSICIPVYNRARTVRCALDSALSQTYSHCEIIVVDNASTDATWDTLREYATKYSQIKIFRNESNLGPVRNWRRAVDEASGEFVKILFSDDTMAPDCVSELLAPFHQYQQIAFTICAAEVAGSENDPSGLHVINYFKESGVLPLGII